MGENKQPKQSTKSGKQEVGVANPGQPLTGNKNQGDDLEEVVPRDALNVDRPTRDDGDNDDQGALGGGDKR